LAALDNTTEVETPERIRFRYRAAGPVRRSFAYALDLLIRVGIVFAVAMLVAIVSSVKKDELAKASEGVILVVMFALEWGYYVAFETLWNGGSPGKRAFGLRVVKEGGFPVGFVDSVLRNLLRAADFLPLGYVVGLTVMVGDGRFRRLGDRVAGTMVVIEDRVRVGESLKLTPPAGLGELEALPVRPLLSAEELEALELFLRRGDLSTPRRLELAEMIAGPFALRMGVRSGDPVRFLALLYERAVGARRPQPSHEVRR
jgi:uncharacterized RDD family membrane protein YckC